MYKTTALMLSLMLTSMPVLADCMAQLDRKTVAEQLSRSIDYLGPLPSDLNCVKPHPQPWLWCVAMPICCHYTI